MSDQIDLFSIDEAIVAIEKQKEHRGEPVIDEDFFGDTGQDEAKARLEARRGGAKFGETGPGFKAFNPINRTAADMVSDYAEHGDAEKTGGVPAKRKTINHTKNYKKYIEALFPDAIEVRYEETWITTYSGMRVKKDRDGFIDFSAQFHDRSEIAFQATTVGAESDHIKKMSTLVGKYSTAGKNTQKWLKSGRRLIFVLIDVAPGKKGTRWNWTPIASGKFVCCHYEIDLEMLQAARDRREKLAASKQAKRKI